MPKSLIFLICLPVLALFAGVSHADGPVRTFTADTRLRYEHLTNDANPDKPNFDTYSHDDKLRMRARVGVQAEINSNTKAQIRLATGKSLWGPGTKSETQDLGDFGGRKTVGFDLAYIDYAVNNDLHLIGGKGPNPFFSAGENRMLWGSYVTFDGLEAIYTTKWDNWKPFASLVYSEEVNRADNSINGPDIYLTGIQAGSSFVAGDFTTTFAAGYYAYNNIKGFAPGSDSGLTAPLTTVDGNSLSGGTAATSAYLNDYNEINVGAQVVYPLGIGPLTVFGDAVSNTSCTDTSQSMALLGGLRLGELKNPSSWLAEYSYRDVGADSLFSMRGDPTFLNGFTNSYGHGVKLAYQIDKNLNAVLYYSGGKRPNKPNAALISTGTGAYEKAYIEVNATF